jgi:hypothetical protein
MMLDLTREIADRFPERSRRTGAALLVALLFTSGWSAPARANDTALARGDSAWARRAVDRDGLRAAPDAIDDAIAAYRKAWGDGAGSLASGWKLVRALWWAGEFADLENSATNARFAEARAVANQALSALDGRSFAGTAVSALAPEEWPGAFAPERHEDVAALLFWSAIAEGAWGRSQGLLANVRQGVAEQSRDRALASVALAPGIDEGGAQRLLSRLHAQLPRVPLITGWVDRDLAVEWAERAVAVSPAHPGNALILALALLDTRVETRRDEAVATLERLAKLEPRDASLLADLSAREVARERLRALGLR